MQIGNNQLTMWMFSIIITSTNIRRNKMRIKMTDSEFLMWIHERLINVHGENRVFDYMWKLREISDNLKEKQNESIQS